MTSARGSVIAGHLPRVDQRAASAQCQIGKAPAQNTERDRIGAEFNEAFSTKNRTPDHSSTDRLDERSVRAATTPITDRQRMVLDYIVEHIGSHGFPPTLREIGKRMCIRSTNGVNDHLRALERKGYIERDETQSRAIRVLSLQAKLDGPLASTMIEVDREAISRALGKLDELADWVPGPIAGRFRSALTEIRMQIVRGIEGKS